MYFKANQTANLKHQPVQDPWSVVTPCPREPPCKDHPRRSYLQGRPSRLYPACTWKPLACFHSSSCRQRIGLSSRNQDGSIRPKPLVCSVRSRLFLSLTQTYQHNSFWRRTEYNQRPCTSLPRTRPPQCSSWCPCRTLRSARSIPFHRGVDCSCRGQGCTGPPTSARFSPSPRPTPSPSCSTPPAGPAPPPSQSFSSGRCGPSPVPLVPPQ